MSGNSGIVEAIVCGGIGIGSWGSIGFSLTFVYLVDTIGGCRSADTIVGYGSGYGIGGIISGVVWGVSSISIRISVISTVSTEVKSGGIGISISCWGSIGFGFTFAEMVGITVSMSIRISVISVVSAISESVTVSVISTESVAVTVMAVVVCGSIGISFGFRCSFGIGGSFSEMVTVVSVISAIRVSVISVAETITVTVSVAVSVMAVVISSGIGVSLGLSGHNGEEGNCKDSLFMNNRAN